MENQRFSRKPGISISMAGATFLDENIKKTSKMNCEMSCMYVWMSILPMQATKMAHPYIHTWDHAVSKIDDFSMYVYFSMACVVEIGYGPAAPLKKSCFSYHPV
jgi:hypothetical protein